ncbi:hypothetical protein ACSLBF_03030 [Pseudoalteromonas sp. T1lg65]|uniref:hypothetical protein n=1 Tax=Pseudoalteromonas sp. T1lg65 TaxID=2077101 RepID=UPI003F78E7F4
MKRSIIALSLTTSLLTSIASYASCEEIYQQQSQKLDVSVNEFDQPPGAGWRALLDAKCYNEAVKLIDDYQQKHNTDNSALEWHYFQLLAFAGRKEEAISVGKKIISELPATSSPEFLWNEYVIASVAFLEGDNQTLMENRNKLAKHKEHFGNKMNLAAIDRLVNNIKQPYVIAYMTQ